MEPDRFKRRTDYAVPPRRPAGPPPVIGGVDQAGAGPAQPIPVAQPAPPQPNGPQPIVSAPAEVPKPIWAQPRSAVTQPTAPDSTSPTAQSKTISVNVSLPKLKRPKLPRIHVSKRTKLITVAVLLLALIVAGGVFATQHFMHHAPQTVLKTGAGQVAAANPTFTPVAPSSKPDLSSTKAAGTAFDGSKNSYSYSDLLDGTPLTVSQQPLPSGFATPQAAIDKIALGIGARTPLKLRNGTTGYIETDAKSNGQILVLTVNNLLLFIQSGFAHSQGAWLNYIANLK